MCPARDQRHVVPVLVEAGPDRPADAARSEDHDSHPVSLGAEWIAPAAGSPFMTAGAWVLIAAVVVALVGGAGWSLTNGVFRGTHRVRRGGFETGAERLPQPPAGKAERLPQPPTGTAERLPQPPTGGAVAAPDPGSVLAGTAYDVRRGERATLLQFSSAFCAPCRATRRTLAEVAGVVPGVAHVEIDAEGHLDLVRSLGVLRTPTTLVLDGSGREVSRATGAPRRERVLAALGPVVA